MTNLVIPGKVWCMTQVIIYLQSQQFESKIFFCISVRFLIKTLFFAEFTSSTRNNDKFFNSEEVDRLVEEKSGGLLFFYLILFYFYYVFMFLFYFYSIFIYFYLILLLLFYSFISFFFIFSFFMNIFHFFRFAVAIYSFKRWSNSRCHTISIHRLDTAGMTQSIEDEQKARYNSPHLMKGSFQFPTPCFSRRGEHFFSYNRYVPKSKNLGGMK